MSVIAEYKKLSKLIGNIIFANSDGDPGKHIEDEIVARDRKYTQLLQSYTTITKVRFWFKEIHKWLFFWLVVAACVFCLIAAYKVITRILATKDIHLLVDAVPAMFAAFTAFVSTIIVVPMTIAKFLFNTKEDDNITTLIKHTQRHDSTGINLLRERFTKHPSHNKSETREQNSSFADIDHD